MEQCERDGSGDEDKHGEESSQLGSEAQQTTSSRKNSRCLRGALPPVDLRAVCCGHVSMCGMGGGFDGERKRCGGEVVAVTTCCGGGAGGVGGTCLDPSGARVATAPSTAYALCARCMRRRRRSTPRMHAWVDAWMVLCAGWLHGAACLAATEAVGWCCVVCMLLHLFFLLFLCKVVCGFMDLLTDLGTGCGKRMSAPVSFSDGARRLRRRRFHSPMVVVGG